ncbi:helix-turn-helix domain-containing protein [Rhodococcus sp. RS1C4]|nr:helix-turn-helix domain-containing protein [Rhodococcus sp. RS1C4]OZC89005.1 helix-turn-helix domain-containing protein [Rhodococcus sp. 06-418-1B]OZD10917.1 helix-turn-helix domain-containing protein [Rhodococcus sp. 06-156-4C]OZD14349.1 helix-turn-helix domain-containing protein [Rhodococcus sp. 06-156-3C]OZD24983.1 helix-turn-helix domain-containing protein [Rhodococcus sp. 06-156-4a]OZD29491.1 helix-turn-helix domain-containing protein [Rhodococcus sp. 06-156-3b]OZD36968.1 helix-turn-h
MNGEPTVDYRHAGDGNRKESPIVPRETSSDSRDNHLTLRRVVRQQRLIEILADSPLPVPTEDLAEKLQVSARTVERDRRRLVESGVPIVSVPGTGGGSRLPSHDKPAPLHLSFEEIAALIAALAALGPTETDSAQSAMTALVAAITPSQPRGLR